MSGTPVEPAVALQFRVVIDGVDIGVFSACEGLSAEYEVEEIKEGGNNGFIHRLPGRVKYQNLKLTRAVDADSAKLGSWFSGLSSGVTTHTAHVTAYDGWKRALAQWSFAGVWPVKYTGPSFKASDTNTANEVLELAHTGFTCEKG